jgi:hypothetical protein
VTPDLLRPDGTLTSDPGLPYVLQDNGVQMIGKPVVSFGALTLLRLPSHPWRLQQAVYNVTNDGWITPPLHAETDTTAEGSWAYFGSGGGTVEIVVSRAGFNAPSLPPANATVRVGPVALNEQRAPVVRDPIEVKHLVVQNGTSQTLSLHVHGPVAVQVSETPTFKPTDYGGTDQRTLGVQVGFKFTPDG